jgi:hypothetical protein
MNLINQQEVENQVIELYKDKLPKEIFDRNKKFLIERTIASMESNLKVVKILEESKKKTK